MYHQGSSANEYYVSVNDARKFADAIRPGKTFKIEPYVVEKDTLLYFINYDKGWVILAGDKRLNPFVAESESGDISMPTSNGNLNAWIDSYASIPPGGMDYYSISYEKSDFDYQIVKADIINSKPVKVTAYRNSSNGLAGHAWVIDGIAQRTRHFVTEKRFEYTDNWMHESEYYESFDDLRYRYNINDEFDVVIEEGGTSVTDFLLMNWGYDGAYNDDYFSTYPSTAWTIYTDRNYEYDKTIYYDFN